MLYLSVPYSSNEESVQVERYIKSCEITAKLMEAGIPVYNPLANSIPAIELGDCNLDHKGWMNIDIQVLRLCSMMVVLELAGWEESKGVQEEIEAARSMDLAILRVPYDANTVKRILHWQ